MRIEKGVDQLTVHLESPYEREALTFIEQQHGLDYIRRWLFRMFDNKHRAKVFLEDLRRRNNAGQP